jgi:hypothetical protein
VAGEGVPSLAIALSQRLQFRIVSLSLLPCVPATMRQMSSFGANMIFCLIRECMALTASPDLPQASMEAPTSRQRMSASFERAIERVVARQLWRK